MKLIIEMQDEENYAAHGGFDGNFRWKYKIGATYVINNVDVNELDAIVKEVEPFISEDSEYFKSYIATWYVLADDEDTEYVKNQKEYGGGWDTIYMPTELKQNSKGTWFLKRGYICGDMVKSNPEYAHLAGKFCGWVDNLATGECVMEIQGEKRIPKLKEAA
jgi:hypothetical protein